MKDRFNLPKLLAVVLLCVPFSAEVYAQVLTKIADLGGSGGSNPFYMSFVQGTDGSFYGTNSNDSSGGGGSVFKVTLGGTVTTLYKFCSQPQCADGSLPFNGLTLATDGNFYGVTYQGGLYGEGSIFQLTPQGVLKSIYSFCQIAGCADGRLPIGGLIEATDGDLYGTTGAGGAAGAGTIFRVSHSGALTVLYSFMGLDGIEPYAALTEGIDGELYGTTQRAGSYETGYYGNVFKITRSGLLTDLVTFAGGDDTWPSAPLVRGKGQIFYGTTTGGYSPNGAIFSITPQGTLTNLYVFCQQQGCPDGGAPLEIAAGTDGNLYGVTPFGGANTSFCNGCGTVYQFTPANKLTTLYSFCTQSNCADGDAPNGGLLQATNGRFYGTTYFGGALGGGTVFELDMGLKPFVSFVQPAGRIDHMLLILGQGFLGATNVTLNLTPTSFAVISDTFIKATVPSGATTGYVTVTTPSEVLTSNVPFHVIP